jgi:hypothetical protein
MPPASAFLYTSSQSGNGALRYTGWDHRIPVPDWFRHLHFIIPVPDGPDARQSGIWAFEETVQR